MRCRGHLFLCLRHLAIHRKTHRSTGVLGLATRGAVFWCTGRRSSHDNATHSLPQHYWFRWLYTRQRCICLTRLPSRDLFFYEKPEGRARPWFASIIFTKRLSSSLSAFRFLEQASRSAALVGRPLAGAVLLYRNQAHA